MAINLQRDAKKIYKHIVQRVKDYPKYVNAGPGNDEDPISLIELGYQWDQAGWCALVFDTRPGAEPDGEWNSYIEENSLAFDSWFEACEACWESGKPVRLTLPNGEKKVIEKDNLDDMATHIGEMLKGVLIQAREDGVFAKLPLAERCIMGVEDLEGAYGWPLYERRVKDGAVQ